MRIALVALFAVLILIVAYWRFSQAPERWAVYYGSALPAETFMPFDLVVFDRQGHPPLQSLTQKNKMVLGYLSLGEAETFRDNYAWLHDNNLILETGSEWKGNPVIDVRNPQWEAYILDVLIPDILHRGFDGIMLDTSDSLIWLEHTNAPRYQGLQQAAVQIIKNIRIRYPHLKIMLNRGFELLPQVGDDIDMVLAESIYPYEKDGQDTKEQDEKDYQNYRIMLAKAKSRSPHLKVYTLDYLDQQDEAGMRHLYRIQREQGFIPYVCPPGLQTVVQEPD